MNADCDSDLNLLFGGSNREFLIIVPDPLNHKFR